MSDSRVYDVSPKGAEWPDHVPTGLYRDEEALVADLEDYGRSHGALSELLVHVYETDATRLGIGRKHLGTIEAHTVVERGEVDLTQVE